MRGKKGNLVLIGATLAIWIIVSMILTLILRGIAPCVHGGLAFVGMLFLVGAIIFGIVGNLHVAGVSGVPSAVFLFLAFAFGKCF